jgi:t-SNARE complex subunit (syntaxin)
MLSRAYSSHRSAEKSLLEISELQTTLASNLSIQSAHIDQLVADSFTTTENVGSGNKELKKATERKSTARMVFYGTSAFCLTLVLWDLFI